jgi:peptidoglycan/LPS O-acetylase OafA/YrhL
VSATPRLSGLDGLRGVAALVVMIYHGTKIVVPTLTGAAETAYNGVAESPLKLTFAGTEAVLVFFALSGLVVALPALRPGFSWRAYFPSRLIRLYLPVWAALLLAAALIVLVPRDPGSVTAGSWLQTGNAHTVSWQGLLREGSLWPASYDIDNVLWSLRWEVVFSLALPLFVLIGRAVRSQPVIAVVATVVLSTVGRLLDIDALVYLPVFLAGTVLAYVVPGRQGWGAQRGSWFWVAVTAISGALLVASWLARPLAAPGSLAGRALWGVSAAGAVGLVVTAAGSPGAARLLSRAVPAWLGRVSFSLYLVHVPVLATLAYLWGERAWPAVLGVGFTASLLLAELFRRLVEGPSHRLAQHVRRTLGRDGETRRAVPSPSAP